MPKIEDFMKAINYEINDGANFGWSCYGEFAFTLNSNRKNGCAQIIYDSNNQRIYEISCCNYKNKNCFRWINPRYKKKHIEESESRGFRFEQAWDNVDYIEVDEKKIIKECKKVSKHV